VILVEEALERARQHMRAVVGAEDNGDVRTINCGTHVSHFLTTCPMKTGRPRNRREGIAESNVKPDDR
jgi:hypothetical protein